LLLSPLLIALAIAVALTSRGGAFYGQTRVGRGGRAFTMWKLRSMVASADQVGPAITASGDKRVTPFGRFLRKWKLDELPQLWNVLTGEMSLVGPRPELPVYVRLYSPEQCRVLEVRPGITDPASVKYRNEEQVLASADDRESCYRNVLMPHKLQLNLEYIRAISFAADIKVLLQTLRVLPAPEAAVTAAAGSVSRSG